MMLKSGTKVKRSRSGEARDRNFVHDGYSYHQTQPPTLNKFSQLVTQVRCIKDFVPKGGDTALKCSASGKFVDGKFVPSSKNNQHNHERDPNLIEDKDFRKDQQESSKVFCASTKKIYITSEIKYPNAAARHPYAKRRRSIQQYKKTEQPLSTTIHYKNSKDLNAFAQSLELAVNEEELHYGTDNSWKISTSFDEFTLVTNNCQKSVKNLYIYDADFLADICDSVEHIFVDATFKAVPYFDRKNVHLLTIMAKVEGESSSKSAAVPIFWAIMTNKGEECYKKVFNFLKLTIPTFNPTSYMSDFEIGFHNAIEAAFPNIDANHCYFHYAQAIIKNASDFGLINKTIIKPSTHPEVYIVIKQIIALALLPPSLIMKTFERIKEAAISDFGQHFDRLFHYYERYWIKIVKPKGFSVYNSRIDKTNNYEESYNRSLNGYLTKNPNLNQFFTIIKYLALDARVFRESVKLNKYVSKAPTASTEKDRLELEAFWDMLDESFDYVPELEIDGFELINGLKQIKQLRR